MKIFNTAKLGAEGKILGFDEFKPFSDLGGLHIGEEYKSRIIETAKRELDKDYPVLPASVYMQFKRNGNRSNYEKLYFARRRTVYSLALAEYIERKGRFTDKLLDGVWLILEETSWVIPAHNRGKSSGHPLPAAYRSEVDYIDLFSAETGSLLAWVFHLTGDILDETSPLICERILYELNRRIVKPFIKSEGMDWMGFAGQKVNNWNPWIVSNILTVCALCVRDGAEREIIAGRSMRVIDFFTAHYKTDGGCDEGPSYWGAAGASYFDCLELLYDLSGGVIDVFAINIIAKMGEYIANMHIDGNYFVNFADSSPVLNPDYKMIMRFGRRSGSERLERFGENGILTQGDSYRVPTYHLYRAIKNLCENNKITYGSYTAPDKVWMDGISVMTIRGNGLFLAMKGGHNAESHNHNDIGNFIVYRDGSPLFCDVGVATYTAKTFSSERYDIWTMQSQYHNLPTINGVMQSPGKSFRAESVSYDEETGSLSLDIAKAYPIEADVKSYVRKGELIDDKIIITDTVTLNKEGEVVFNLITVDKPEFLKTGGFKIKNTNITYDKTLKVDFDEIQLDDQKLKNDWKQEELYRIRLTALSIINGVFKLIIE